MTFLPEISTLDKSLFGGVRAHPDLAVFERLHDYPGVVTAYDPEAYGFSSVGTGACTHLPNHASLRLSTNDGTATHAARLRTHDFVRYQPGCMPVVQGTICTSTAFATLKVKRRSSTSGTPTDYTLATITGFDSSKYNRYEIRYAYLGVQGALFAINGQIVHYENFA